MITSQNTPVEIDSALAAAEYAEFVTAQELERAARRVVFAASGYGEKLTLEQAEAHLAAGGQCYYGDEAESLASLAAARTAASTACSERARIEDLYTGWARFFVVTSSTGHVHSSTHCSTCYPTTQFGRVPELSGSDEAAAIALCGPALCTVCFPDAPVESVAGKLTKKQAGEFAWSHDREAKEAAAAERVARKIQKAASALKHAEREAHKVDAIVEQFGRDDRAAYDALLDGAKLGENAYYIYSDMVSRSRGDR